MKKMTFCPECRNEVEFELREEMKTRFIKDQPFEYKTIKAYCKNCNEELSIPEIDDKDIELFDMAYRKKEDIIFIDEIIALMDKYQLGKAPLALALGFGEITITRYLEGQIPSKKYSDIMRRALNDYEFMLEKINENKEKMSEKNFKKTYNIISNLLNEKNGTPKIQSAAKYIITQTSEITPLALQKLLYFSQGLYLATYNKPIFKDDCEAWVHGPVYPDIYRQFKSYGFTPIDEKKDYYFFSCIDLNDNEKEILDLVVQTFGIYSGKTLENITHKEEPWINARNGISIIECSNNKISKEAVEKYFSNLFSENFKLNKENVVKYIHRMLMH